MNSHPHSSLRGSLVLLALAGALFACEDDDDTSEASSSGRVTGDADAGPPQAGRDSKPGSDKPASGLRKVEIRFAPKVGKRDFACGQRYAGVGTPDREIEPVDFRFYVHDLRLIAEDGKEVAVQLEQDKQWQYKNVAMLDFEDASGECNEGDGPMHTTLTGEVAPGKYNGIKFTLGIPLELNHADLSAQPAPLNKSGLFWGWNLGHLFFSAVSRTATLIDEDAGTADADAGAGVPSVNDHFTHVGSTGCEGNPVGGVPVKSCSHPNRPEYTLKAFDPDKQVITADFAAVKRGSDLAVGRGCHSFTADTCRDPFAQLGIDFDSGEAKPATQTVFGVE